MKIDIRENIKENFKDSSLEEMEDSIVASLKEKEELTLPGLGVFFELLWENANKEEQKKILETIKKGL